ncbi:hypothetical protein F7725_006244, partial [Dissostichus mawsoni]
MLQLGGQLVLDGGQAWFRTGGGGGRHLHGRPLLGKLQGNTHRYMRVRQMRSQQNDIMSPLSPPAGTLEFCCSKVWILTLRASEAERLSPQTQQLDPRRRSAMRKRRSRAKAFFMRPLTEAAAGKQRRGNNVQDCNHLEPSHMHRYPALGPLLVFLVLLGVFQRSGPSEDESVSFLRSETEKQTELTDSSVSVGKITTKHSNTSGSSPMIVNILRTTLGVLMLIPVFLLSLWLRKKKALRSTTEAHEPEEIELDSDPEYENDSHTAAQTEDTEEQEDMNKLGRSYSTLHLSVVAGSSPMIVNILRTTLGVLMLIPVFLLSLDEKKALRSTTEAHEPEEIELDSDPEYENDSHTAAQTEDTEEQEDMNKSTASSTTGEGPSDKEFTNDSEYPQDDSGGLDADSCVSPESLDEKKALRSTTEAHEPEEIELDSDPEYENDSHTAAQTEDTEEQEDMIQIRINQQPALQQVKDHRTRSSPMIVNILRTTLGVLMLIPVFLLSLWMRKKKALRSTTEAHEPEEIELDSDPEYENDSHTAAQTEDTEEQEDMLDSDPEYENDSHTAAQTEDTEEQEDMNKLGRSYSTLHLSVVAGTFYMFSSQASLTSAN